MPMNWQSVSSIDSQRYVCGHCGSDITSNTGYKCINQNNVIVAYIYLCHHCDKPTLLYGGKQVPGPMLGNSVEHLPKDIDDLYGELRRATASGAYTAAVLAGRKLLMHISVDSGAASGKTFVEYVNYLVDNHFAPPNSKGWVDKIREIGNEANHEINIMGHLEASSIVKFLEMLLKFKYEFPHEAADTTDET